MFRQALQVTLINLNTLPLRWGQTLVMFFAMAGSIGLLSSTLALGAGLANQFDNSAREDRAVVLSENVTWVGQSALSRDQYNAISNAPGVAGTRHGKPAVTKDARISVLLPGRADGVMKAVVVRGFSPTFAEVRPEIRLVEGRWFQSGLDEIAVGRMAQTQFAGTGLGDEITMLEGRAFRIVGVFESGDWVESGLVTDADTMLGVYGRQTTNAAIVRLESTQSLEDLREALGSDPILTYQVVHEPDYYQRLVDAWGLFDRIATTIGVALGIATLFCVFNVTFAAVSVRRLELATYKALGFSQSGIVLSILVETLCVALAGASVGSFTAWLLFDGNLVTSGAQDASVVHHLRVSSEVVATGLGAAALISVLGCLGPAIQAVRIPVSVALRRF